MDREFVRELEADTRQFSIDTIRLARLLGPRGVLGPVSDQLVRSAGSVGANHRAVSRSRSPKDFLAKIFIVHEEADEAAHWLSILKETNQDPALTPEIDRLLEQATSLRNFFGRARATARSRIRP